MRIKLPDGATQELRKDDAAHNYDTEPVDWTGTYLATDGSRSRMELASNGGILYLPDGGKYYFGSDNIGYLYEDRHGNRLSFNHSTRTWTDTLGRSLTSPLPLNLASQQQTSGTQSFPMPGLTGEEDREYQLVWKNLGDTGVLLDANEQLVYAGNQTCPNISATYTALFIGTLETRLCKDQIFNPVVLREIILPDGSKYKFQYNKYGEITKIEYPTGASERFEYAVIPTLAYKRDYVQDQSNRGVINRWVKESASATELYWKYEAFKQTNGIRIKTTAPDNQTITEQIVETNWANDFPNPKTKWGFDNPMAGRAFDEKLYSGTTLKSRKLTEYEYTQGTNYVATRDARVKREISIIFEPNETNALVTMTANTYDTAGSSDLRNFSSLNIKSSVNYHFIVVPKTDATTETVGQLAARFNGITPATKTEIDYSYDTNSNYLSATRSILGMVTEQRIINPANNAVVSKSQMRYDEYSFETSGTLPTYASATWQNPNHNYRGNVTSVRSYTDIANNQYIEKHSYFDQYGNLRKAVDGNGNISQIEYNANDYACAYPTLTKTPKPDINGIYGANTELTTQITYDFNTGLPLTSTDANNQTTTMEYADVLLRPTKAIAPNGHQTISEYGTPDANGQLSATQRFIKVKTQIDATNWKEDYTWFDGLGRTYKSQSVDSNGDVFTETEYDNMSRPKKATNPYRTGDTKLWTETTFDQFGRVWKVTSPDNAVVETIYGLATTSGSQIGTVTTVKDQALKERRSLTNALGQLTRVDEPTDSGLGTIASPNQPTNYGYDLLNNLIQVQQIGTNTTQCGGTVSSCTQTRSFVYDAMARLKSATNPESGTINYSYDNNGNLTTKTDARSITTTYTYDALNRVKLRDYSDSTNDVIYKYDNLTNAKGQLIEVDNTISKTKYLSFDIMGRLTSSQQITDGTAYNPMTYSYNLSGALIEETYPSGRVVKNSYDIDGDLIQVQSRKATDTFRNYANSFNFTAAGAVSSMRLGNGRWENMQFNSRLQPTQIGLGMSAANQGLLKLDYEYGELQTNGSVDATKNNGNIAKQTLTVPNVGSNQGFTAVQTYNYDSLNRLKDAKEMIGTTQTWKQTFVYDRYGNRRFDQANTTFPASFSNPNISNPQIDPTNNRFTTGQGYTYDLSGNLITDAEGRSFFYDAENKQKEAKNASNQTLGQYFYDGDGKRIKKYVPSTGEITIFVYDAGGKMVAEYSTIVEPQATAKISYLTNDHLGSPRIITDQNGAIVSRRDFMPFGEEISSTERTTGLSYLADKVRQKFTSYERDNESKLDFAQARYYGYSYGRFTSPDRPLLDQSSSDAQSWNLYLYAGNSPLKYTDPLGLWKQVECEGGATQCWEAEEGDTYDSLAAQLGVSPENLQDFFQNQEIVEGRVFDVSGYKDWLKEGDTMKKSVNDLSYQILSAGPPMGGGLNNVGKAAKSTGIGGWIGKQAKRFGKWLGFVPKTKSVAELATKQLLGSSATEMLKDAVNIVKAFKGTAQQKAELFEAFAKQITQRVGDGWIATRTSAGDGATVFVADKIGRVLVISPQGELYLGNLTQNWKQFHYGPGNMFTPVYEMLQKVK